MFNLPPDILLHVNENLPCSSLGPDLDLSASILHFETEFLLPSVLAKGLSLVSDLFDFVYGGGEFEFTLCSIEVSEDGGLFGLWKGD